MDEAPDRFGWPRARYRLAGDDIALAQLPIRWPGCGSERRSCGSLLREELAVEELRADLARMLSDGTAACGLPVVALTDLWGRVESEGELSGLGLQEVAEGAGNWRASATVTLDLAEARQGRAALEARLRRCVPLAMPAKAGPWPAPTGADLTIEWVTVSPDMTMPDGPLIETWASRRSVLIRQDPAGDQDIRKLRLDMEVRPDGVALGPMTAVARPLSDDERASLAKVVEAWAEETWDDGAAPPVETLFPREPLRAVGDDMNAWRMLATVYGPHGTSATIALT